MDYKKCKCSCEVFMVGTEAFTCVKVNSLGKIEKTDDVKSKCNPSYQVLTCTNCGGSYTLDEINKII